MRCVTRGAMRGAGSAIALLLLLASAAHGQGERTVLLEELTGAWCGYCPDGEVVIDSIASRYGGRVIPIAFHNRDAMAIPEELELATRNLGYPSLMVDRHRFGAGALGSNDRSNWSARVEERLAAPAAATIAIDLSYDDVTRRLVIVLRATFSESVSGDIRFNACIVEDSIVGVGNGYDQSNYFDRDATHPLHGRGNPAVGYVHRHVARAMLGGAWGSEGSMPREIPAGSVLSHRYELTLPRAWNPDRIGVVGVAARYGAKDEEREIINAAERRLFDEGPSTRVTAIDRAVVARRDPSSVSSRFIITNLSGRDLSYTAEAVTTARTPADWRVAIDRPDFTLAAGASDTCSILLQPGPTPGAGDARLLLRVAAGDVDRRVYNDSATLLADEIRRVHIFGDEARDASLPADAGASYIELTERQWSAAMNDLPDLDHIAWSGGGRGSMSEETADRIDAILRRGGRALIAAQVALPLLAHDHPDHPLLSTLGVRFPGDAISSAPSYDLEAYPGDPVLDGWSAGIELPAGSFPLQGLIVPDGSAARPMLRLHGTERLLGAWSEIGGHRAAIVGIDPSSIIDTARRDELLRAALRWLDRPASASEGSAGATALHLEAAPNPFRERTMIRIEGAPPGALRLVLYDLMGRQIAELRAGESGSAGRSLELEAGALPSGLYRLAVISTWGSAVLPLIRQ